MQVETYEVNEVTSDGEVDKLDDAAVALITKMGLRGQERLVGAKDDGQVAVLPYQEMTAEEVAVYEALFPQKDDLSDYAAGPLPLRVLQVAAFAKDRGWFNRLQVWHKRAGSAKEDPVLVGVIGHPQHPTLDRQKFLLARWGDALKPYRDLLAEAAASARASLRGAIAKTHADLNGVLAVVDSIPDGAAVRWVSSPPRLWNEEPPR